MFSSYIIKVDRPSIVSYGDILRQNPLFYRKKILPITEVYPEELVPAKKIVRKKRIYSDSPFDQFLQRFVDVSLGMRKFPFSFPSPS